MAKNNDKKVKQTKVKRTIMPLRKTKTKDALVKPATGIETGSFLIKQRFLNIIDKKTKKCAEVIYDKIPPMTFDQARLELRRLNRGQQDVLAVMVRI